MFDNLVALSLEALKKRLNHDGELYQQSEQGYCEPAVCYFNPPAQENDIDTFFQEHNLVIPNDYKQFLLIHNGARFFVHPYYGGGFEVFGLKEICQHYIEYDYKNLIPEGWYPIGCDNGDMLFISSKECCVNQRENSYLYWTEMLFTDSAIELELNFGRWLERLLICNGALFWLWRFERAENYYRGLKEHMENIKKYGQ